MNIDENRCTVVRNHSKSMKIVVLSFKITQTRWKSLCCRCTVVPNRAKSMKIVVLSLKIIQKRWKSLYSRSKSMKIVVLSLHCHLKSFKIDKNCCIIVQNHFKSMNIVVLWFKIVQIDGNRRSRSMNIVVLSLNIVQIQ